MPTGNTLQLAISQADSQLFAAFNAKDTARFFPFFSEDLELYQDNVGTRNHAQTLTAFRNLFLLPYALRREAIQGSIAIYPIKGYGAIQTGKHTFCHQEGAKLICSTFQFLHIWQYKNGKWQITRLITYDH